jgi:hypothetical protein
MTGSSDGSPYSATGDPGPVSSGGSEPPSPQPGPPADTSSGGAPYSATGDPGPVSSSPPVGIEVLPDGVYLDPSSGYSAKDVSRWIEEHIESGLTVHDILEALRGVPLGTLFLIDRKTLRRLAGEPDGA